MYYVSGINLLYSMTLCHYFLNKYFRILNDMPESIEIYVCMKHCGWAFTLMGSLSIRCWEIDANKKFSFNLVLLVFFQIDRFVFAYFSPCYSRRIGARVLFYFPSANLPGTGTHYIINTPLLFIYNSGFSFYQHLCFYIPQKNRNLSLQKKLTALHQWHLI